MDFELINAQFCALRDQVKIKKGHIGFYDLAMQPKGDGTPHIEIDGDRLHFVISERGVEYERRTTSDLDELLYWLVTKLTHYAAQERLRRSCNPQWNKREVWFREEEKILNNLNPTWGQRRKTYHDWLLYPEKRDELPRPIDFLE